MKAQQKISEKLNEIVNFYPYLIDIKIRATETKAFFEIWHWVKYDEYEVIQDFDNIIIEL